MNPNKTNGSKDKRKWQRTSQHETRNVTTCNLTALTIQMPLQNVEKTGTNSAVPEKLAIPAPLVSPVISPYFYHNAIMI